MPACLCYIRSREVRSVGTLRRTVCVYNTERKNLYFKKKKPEESIWRNNSSKENLYNGGDVVYFFIYSTPENILL